MREGRTMQGRATGERVLRTRQGSGITGWKGVGEQSVYEGDVATQTRRKKQR